MTVTKTSVIHDYDPDEWETLNYELIGIVDVVEAANGPHSELLFDFFTKTQPTKHLGQYLSYMSEKVSTVPEAKELPHVPYGMFVPTKEVNPDSDRPFKTRAEIEQYRKDHPFIVYMDRWTCWEDVLFDYGAISLEDHGSL